MLIKVWQPKLKLGQDLKLWAFPKIGGAPVLIGLLFRDQKI